jgi:glycosyltransferase involved in cell wall biosynthesis
MGGGLLLHRHFNQFSEFEVGVITNNPASVRKGFHRVFQEPFWLARMKRTRLSVWFHDYTHLVHSRTFDARLLESALEFKPDIIFNVAETYLSFQAQKLATRLDIPFVCYFMDWAHFAACQHRYVVPLMDRIYRKLYRKADLAFCISEGMKEELGPHANVRVIYPMPGEKSKSEGSSQGFGSPFLFAFAGNLAHWYGDQVRQILDVVKVENDLTLRVYGDYHSWPEDAESEYRDLGLFSGFLPFEELDEKLDEADAFFLPMGFVKEAEIIEKTSFKTKFLDYLSYRKPILIWGPEYCTATRIARKYNAAACVTDPDPNSVLQMMRKLASDQNFRESIVINADQMLAEELSGNRSHNRLVEGMYDLIETSA